LRLAIPHERALDNAKYTTTNRIHPGSSAMRCEWCEHSIGTISMGLVYCEEYGVKMRRDSTCDKWIRAIGNDDNKTDVHINITSCK
jgi:hypothetical protein